MKRQLVAGVSLAIIIVTVFSLLNKTENYDEIDQLVFQTTYILSIIAFSVRFLIGEALAILELLRGRDGVTFRWRRRHRGRR